LDIEKFTELLDEKIFEIAKELRDEFGLSNLIINQDSTYSTGQITISLAEK
jgi:vacuolar-type H+-ATPase subunit E/Vma4